MIQFLHRFARSVAIVAFPSKTHGGCEEYALTVARALVEHNFEVHTLFPKSKDTHRLRQAFSKIETSYTPLTLRYWLPGYFRRIRFGWDILRIVLYLLRKRPSVVHISLPWPDTSTELLLACALLRVRTVVTFQLVSENFKISSKLIRWYLWARNRNQQWIAVSGNNRKILGRAFRISYQEICLIPNGVKLPDQPSSNYSIEEIDKNSPFILAVGRLSYQKGFDVLLKAYANILLSFPEYKLVIMGEGELYDELKQLAVQLGIAHQVLFTGKRSDVFSWLYKAKLFTLPSRSEGQSFALLEAMAVGVPIIASNASSIPDLIIHDKEGIIFEKDNVLDLAQKLCWALMHLDAMSLLAKNAKTKAKQFTQESMLYQTFQLLGIKYTNLPDQRL